jgi:hypothetical protein
MAFKSKIKYGLPGSSPSYSGTGGNHESACLPVLNLNPLPRLHTEWQRVSYDHAYQTALSFFIHECEKSASIT